MSDLFIENIKVTCNTCGDFWLVSQATFNAGGYAHNGVACTSCEMAWYKKRGVWVGA